MMADKELVFVYNADSGPLALVGDYLHKIVSPQTYECNLCQVTYGNLGMKRKWKKFVKSLPYLAVFLHRDQLIGEYEPLGGKKLPAMFVNDGDKFRSLISSGEINKLKNLAELVELV